MLIPRTSKQLCLPCKCCRCMNEGDGYAVVGINDVTENNFITGHSMWGNDFEGTNITYK